MTDSQSEDTMVAALLRERVGLVARGLDDRVAQVDEQLKLRGHKPPTGKTAEQVADGAATDEAARQEPPKSPQKSGARQQTRTAD